MKIKFTRITVGFLGRGPRERKDRYCLLTVADLEGHVTVDADQFNELERKAWRKIDEEGFKLSAKQPRITALLCAQFGEVLYGDLERVEMLPKQRQNILK